MNWYKAYKKTKKGTLKPNPHIPWVRTCCGVYLIRSRKTKKIKYIGHSKSDIYKTMYRHFQDWDDPTQYRATYSPGYYEVGLIPTKKERVEKLERYLVSKMRPEDQKVYYEDYNPQERTKDKIRTDLEGADAKDILPGGDEDAPF